MRNAAARACSRPPASNAARRVRSPTNCDRPGSPTSSDRIICSAPTARSPACWARARSARWCSGGRRAPARPPSRGCWRRRPTSHFEQISAIFSGVADLKKVFEEARARRETGQGTLLFVDEIHRFNRAQQDSFPAGDGGRHHRADRRHHRKSLLRAERCALVARPRARLQAARRGRDRAAVGARGGDRRQGACRSTARRAPRSSAWPTATAAPPSRSPRKSGAQRRQGEVFDAAKLQEVVQRRAPIYDKQQDSHYNLISALHKSVRGSDPDAALYYLCRMLDAGEDPLYLARRIVRMAVEDIGLGRSAGARRRQCRQGRLRFSRLAGRRTGDRGSRDLCCDRAQIERRLRRLRRRDAHRPGSRLAAAAQAYSQCADQADEVGRLWRRLRNTTTTRPTRFPARTISPRGSAARQFYDPPERGFEREIRKRLDYWAKLRRERSP